MSNSPSWRHRATSRSLSRRSITNSVASLARRRLRTVFSYSMSGMCSPQMLVDGLRRLAASFLGAGRVDEVRRVDWTPDVVAGAMARWYGDPWTPTDANGRARYQYVHTVESSTEPLVLHVDSDMLFHGDMGDWLDRIRSMFDQNDDMVAVVPNGVIPQATRRIEWLLGPRFDRPSWPSGWAGTDVTSRGVLLHRDRVIERALPLVRGAADEQWERSVQAAFQRCRAHGPLPRR